MNDFNKFTNKEKLVYEVLNRLSIRCFSYIAIILIVLSRFDSASAQRPIPTASWNEVSSEEVSTAGLKINELKRDVDKLDLKKELYNFSITELLEKNVFLAEETVLIQNLLKLREQSRAWMKALADVEPKQERKASSLERTALTLMLSRSRYIFDNAQQELQVFAAVGNQRLRSQKDRAKELAQIREKIASLSASVSGQKAAPGDQKLRTDQDEKKQIEQLKILQEINIILDSLVNDCSKP